MIRPLVYDIALTVGFRGITRRSGIVFEGPAGWAEWSPFVEYSDEEAAPWLLAALEAASEGYPTPVRDRVEVNGIVPSLAPADAAARAVASSAPPPVAPLAALRVLLQALRWPDARSVALRRRAGPLRRAPALPALRRPAGRTGARGV